MCEVYLLFSNSIQLIYYHFHQRLKIFDQKTISIHRFPAYVQWILFMNFQVLSYHLTRLLCHVILKQLICRSKRGIQLWKYVRQKFWRFFSYRCHKLQFVPLCFRLQFNQLWGTNLQMQFSHYLELHIIFQLCYYKLSIYKQHYQDRLLKHCHRTSQVNLSNSHQWD